MDDLTVSLNTTPDLKAGVEVSDNSLEDIQYKIDDKNLDTSKKERMKLLMWQKIVLETK
ncbi:MAG: hypothetical protein ACLR43_00630 [Faecalibacillus faecis]